jgi:hypothetical protein
MSGMVDVLAIWVAVGGRGKKDGTIPEHGDH